MFALILFLSFEDVSQPWLNHESRRTRTFGALWLKSNCVDRLKK